MTIQEQAPSLHPHPGRVLWVGVGFCVLAGVALAALVGHQVLQGESDHNTAMLVAASAAALLSALALSGQSTRPDRAPGRVLRHLSGLAGPSVAVVLAAMGTWVALGPGASECTGSYLWWTGLPPSWECRIAFGAGALLVWGILLFAWGAHLTKHHGDRGLPRVLQNIGKAMLLLPLAPLLLLLIAGALLKAGADWLGSGRSPSDPPTL